MGTIIVLVAYLFLQVTHEVRAGRLRNFRRRFLPAIVELAKCLRFFGNPTVLAFTQCPEFLDWTQVGDVCWALVFLHQTHFSRKNVTTSF